MLGEGIVTEGPSAGSPSQDAMQNRVFPRNHHGIRAPSNALTQTVCACGFVGLGEGYGVCACGLSFPDTEGAPKGKEFRLALPLYPVIKKRMGIYYLGVCVFHMVQLN